MPDRSDTNHFGLLLLVLVATYLISAFSTARWITTVQVVLVGAVTVLGARSSTLPRREVTVAVAILLTGTAIMLGVSQVNTAGRGIANIWIALVLLLAAMVIVYRVLISPTVTLQSIYGAVSAYLLLGLMFAAIFAAMDHLGGGHFFVNGEPANAETFQYFSFTTLTTLGYGDFTAAGASGRAFAILEALTGQIFLATLIARLVAAFRRPDERRR